MPYQTTPFDQAVNYSATIDDIDKKKVQNFLRHTKLSATFQSKPRIRLKTLLKHLNLVDEKGLLTNAAILLFGKQPQKFFISSSVMCAQFYGNKVERPIQGSQLIMGDLFELIEQSTNFVMNRTKGEAIKLSTKAVHEAIAYAVSHRDYTSNASVQVMLLKNRLEIWHPGENTHKARQNNMKIPQMMHLCGFIPTKRSNLINPPVFNSGVDFKTVIWKNKE